MRGGAESSACRRELGSRFKASGGPVTDEDRAQRGAGLKNCGSNRATVREGGGSVRAGFRALAVTQPMPRALGRPGPVRGGAKGSAAFVAHASGNGARVRDVDLEPSRRRSRRYGLGLSARGGLSEGGVRA